MVRNSFKTTLRKFCLSKLLSVWPKCAKVAKADALLREVARIFPWKQLFHMTNNVSLSSKSRGPRLEERKCISSLWERRILVTSEWCIFLQSASPSLNVHFCCVVLFTSETMGKPSSRSFMQVLEYSKDPTVQVAASVLLKGTLIQEGIDVRIL